MRLISSTNITKKLNTVIHAALRTSPLSPSLSLLLLLAVTTIYSPTGFANNTPVALINSNNTPFNLATYVEFIPDPTLAINYDRLQSGEFDHLWQQNTLPNFRGSNPNSQYWFRITIRHSKDFSLKHPVLYIPTSPSMLYELNFWVPQHDGQIKKFETGGYRPYKQKDVKGYRYAFYMPNTDETYTIIGLAKQQLYRTPAMLPMYLQSEKQAIQADAQANYIRIAFYAIMVALVIYNACLFLSIRQPLYGTYVAYLISAMLACTYADGSILSWPWPTQATSYQVGRSNNVLLFLIYLAFIWEALEHLRFSPPLKKTFTIIFAIGVVAFFHNVFDLNTHTALIYQAYGTLVTLWTFIAIIIAMKHRTPTAGYLLVAEVFFFSGALMTLFLVRGLLPINELTLWVAHAGYLFEVLLLSFALADRTNRAINAQLAAQQLATLNERKAHEAMAIATKAKNEFLAGVSHELRTPLTSIIGFTEDLIQKQWIAQQGIEEAYSVLHAGKQLLYVVDNILNLSLIDNHQIKISREIIKLESLVYLFRSKHLHAAVSKNISYEVNVKSPLPENIIIDAEHLQQIMHQLITNAIKFTDKGNVSINIEANQDSTRLTIIVSDSGIGIPKNKMTQIFQPFTQVDSSNTRNYGGTGVGLFIAKSLTELIGGKLMVESIEGIGSSFILCLPYETANDSITRHDLPQAQDFATQDNPNYTAPSLSGRILYAEDNKDNQRLVKVLVAATGATLDLVNNGQEAIEAVLNSYQLDDISLRYNLILMDIQMPLLDGVSAAQQIKSLHPDIPIIAFSASTVKNTIDNKTCFDNYLSKPVDKQKLYTMLSNYLTQTAHIAPRNRVIEDIEPTRKEPSAQLTSSKNCWNFSIRDALLKDADIAPLVKDFEDHIVHQLTQWKALRENKDWEELMRELHQLKGAAGGFGHVQLTEIANEANRALKEEKYTRFLVSFAKIEQYISSVSSSKRTSN